MKSVIDIEKEEDVKLNGLVTVVNALKASKQMKAFGEFFNNQIEYATVVVLSRSQNATPEQLELCVKQIQTLNPKAAIITTAWDAIKGEQILKVIEGADSLEMKLMAEQHAKEEAEEHEHEHHHHDHDHEDHDHEHDHEHHHEHDDMHADATITKNMSMITATTMNTITIMTTTTMSTIMNMTKTAPADAMTMSIIITIMQMKCLQAGEKRRLTNSRRKRSRMY